MIRPMSPSTAPISRYERRRVRNREALIDAAIELFQERGTRGTKLEDICELADVAPRTFFNHFETREHLYRAIAQQRGQQLAALIEAQIDQPRPLDESLTQLFAEMGTYLSARPAYRELVGEMLHLGLDGGSEAARGGSLGRAALRFVEHGVVRDEFTRRHSPEVLADLLLGAITTAITNWCADEDYDLNEGLEKAARALLDLFT
jgi:AcrR family transcriptional regulator